MARTKSRWGRQAAGKRHGSLSRATGTPKGRPIPARELRAASRGKYGKRNSRRASQARRNSR